MNFFDTKDISDDLLRFAVIAARYNGKWIFCRHKERDTYEIPGGHREEHENILDTAKRELFEETGATKSALKEICVYSVVRGDDASYGMLYFAEVSALGQLPEDMEMAEVIFCDTLPEKLTYPQIQPFLFAKIKQEIVGDSLAADIKGGNNAEIHTCWFNPKGAVNDKGVTVDFEIKSLMELKNIVM